MIFMSSRKKNTSEKEFEDVVLPEQQIKKFLMEKVPQEYKRNENFKVFVKEDVDFQYFVEMHIHLDTDDIETIKKESKYLADLFLFPPYPVILYRFVFYKSAK